MGYFLDGGGEGGWSEAQWPQSGTMPSLETFLHRALAACFGSRGLMTSRQRLQNGPYRSRQFSGVLGGLVRRIKN